MIHGDLLTHSIAKSPILHYKPQSFTISIYKNRPGTNRLDFKTDRINFYNIEMTHFETLGRIVQTAVHECSEIFLQRQLANRLQFGTYPDPGFQIIFFKLRDNASSIFCLFFSTL